jgi:hypothetical protein
MPGLYDGVSDTSTTTGTGTVTVSGTAVTGYAAFSTVPNGTVVDYAIRHQSAAEYETGRGTVVTSTTLSRTNVVTSSNSNALVNFSAGTKSVFVTVVGRSVISRGKANALALAGNSI